MSWRRGLPSLWLIGGTVWLIGWILFIRGRCHALSVPVAVLVVGSVIVALAWFLRRMGLP